MIRAMLRPHNLHLFFTLFAALCIPVAAQEPDAQQTFAGVWEATFKGDVFMILKLEAGDKISGTLSGGQLSVDHNGEIIEASGGGKELPISNARIEGTKLSFDWKDSDDETVKLETTVTENGKAQLRFMDLPEGHKMKPIALKQK